MKSFWWSAALAVLLGCGPGVGFELSAPASVTVTQGASVLVNAMVTRKSGFNEDVTVSLLNPPAGISAAPVTLHRTAQTAALVLAADATVVSGGPVVLSVEARSASGARQASIALLVRGLPGTLDPRFGAGGTLVRELATGINSIGRAVAVDAQGRLLVAGKSFQDDSSIFVARFTPAGGIDPTFGQGGVVTTGFCESGNARADALVLLADGRIVVAGATDCSGLGNDFALVRLLPNGAPDTGFGTSGDGHLVTHFDGSAMAHALLLQPDGKLVAGGSVFLTQPDPSAPQQEHFALARYAPDGTLDSSFGTGGRVTLGFDEGAVGELNALALQPDGKLVAAGAGGYLHYSALARFGSDGQVDTGFGSNGRVLQALGANSEVFALAVQPDGKIATAGTANDGNNNFNFAVARYRSDGTLDPEFGSGGFATTDFASGNDYAYALTLTDDGMLVASGGASDGTASSFALARYRSDGRIDDAFGTLGKARIGFPGDASAYAAAPGPDGTLLLAGAASTGSPPQFNLAFARAWQ